MEIEEINDYPISRRAVLSICKEVIDMLEKDFDVEPCSYMVADKIAAMAEELPEYKDCRHCAEFDEKNSRCPKFCAVIEATVKELAPRCKDCGHAEKRADDTLYCQIWDREEMPEDGYCHRGENRS